MVLSRKHYKNGSIIKTGNQFFKPKKHYNGGRTFFHLFSSRIIKKTIEKRGTILIIPYYQSDPSGTVFIILQKPIICGTQIYNAFLGSIIKTVPYPVLFLFFSSRAAQRSGEQCIAAWRG